VNVHRLVRVVWLCPVDQDGAVCESIRQDDTTRNVFADHDGHGPGYGQQKGRGLHLRIHTARDRQALLRRTASHPSLQHRQENAGDGAKTCGRESSLAMNSAMNAAMSGRWQCNNYSQAPDLAMILWRGVCGAPLPKLSMDSA
jgi:hypothetical protein